MAGPQPHGHACHRRWRHRGGVDHADAPTQSDHRPGVPRQEAGPARRLRHEVGEERVSAEGPAEGLLRRRERHVLERSHLDRRGRSRGHKGASSRDVRGRPWSGRPTPSPARPTADTLRDTPTERRQPPATPLRVPRQTRSIVRGAPASLPHGALSAAASSLAYRRATPKRPTHTHPRGANCVPGPRRRARAGCPGTPEAPAGGLGNRHAGSPCPPRSAGHPARGRGANRPPDGGSGPRRARAGASSWYAWRADRSVAVLCDAGVGPSRERAPNRPSARRTGPVSSGRSGRARRCRTTTHPL